MNANDEDEHDPSVFPVPKGAYANGESGPPELTASEYEKLTHSELKEFTAARGVVTHGQYQSS